MIISTYWFINVFFFLLRFSFTDTDDSQDRRGREGTIFYSTLPLPPAHEHSDIYLQLCMWDDYHVFLIATLVFTRLLLDEIYYLIELPFDFFVYLGFLSRTFRNYRTTGEGEGHFFNSLLTFPPALQTLRY